MTSSPSIIVRQEKIVDPKRDDLGGQKHKEDTRMQKIRINEDNQATILCRACGRWKATDAGVFCRTYKPLRVSCPCGAIFRVIRELRQTYRKQAYLSGTYWKVGSPYKACPMYVENVSQGGVALHVTSPYDLRINDGLEVTFGLNDQAGSQINEYGYIKYIQNHTVGVQFAADRMQPYRKALGFYLMSA